MGESGEVFQDTAAGQKEKILHREEELAVYSLCGLSSCPYSFEAGIPPGPHFTDEESSARQKGRELADMGLAFKYRSA
jgi:hypothetical protein